MTPRQRTALVGLVPILATLLTFGASPASARARLQCRGHAATIVGTKASDTLFGTAHADVIMGLQGDDVIRGRGGNDIICGGFDTGEDFYDYDHLFGNKGNDILVGEGGYDRLFGGVGADKLLGGSESDWLFGGVGADKLLGGKDSDALQGGRGNDIIKGGKGGDGTRYSRGPVHLNLATGLSVAKGLGTDHISGIEQVIGSPADDVLFGNKSTNYLFGDFGNDMVSGRGGKDHLDGGAFFPGPTLKDQKKDDGMDVVRGGRGRDLVRGGTNHDRLYGGKGTDHVGDSSTIPLATRGDLVVGGPGHDMLRSSVGDDRLLGGRGRDAVSYTEHSVAAGVTVDLAAETATGDGTDVLSSIAKVFGTVYDDVLLGTSGPNTIEGFAGTDTIRGRAGDDLLGGYTPASETPPSDSAIVKIYGGPGRDRIENPSCIGCGTQLFFGGRGKDQIVGGPSGATIDGGDGSDLIRYVSFNDVDGVSVDLAQGTGTFSSGCGSPSCPIDSLVSIERAAGSIADDVLIGDGGDNVLRGYGGHDQLRGAAGDDRVYGGGGPDRLRGGVGFDHLFGGRGTDSCTGGEVTDSC